MDLGFFFFFINVATKRRVHDSTLRGKCSTFFLFLRLCDLVRGWLWFVGNGAEIFPR